MTDNMNGVASDVLESGSWRERAQVLTKTALWNQRAKAARKKLIPLFYFTTFIGGLFTVGFIGSWIGYCFFNGSSGCAAVGTLFGVFAIPLFAGSVQVLRGRRSGFRLLKCGSLMLICEPGYLVEIWALEKSEEYQFYLEWRARRSATGKNKI